ncbi:hypothetical protein SJDPG2_00705 [Porphyromonas gingivalis SJD2]|nr:hypothetical protein SJDPG2_00705 [Porphyromonas gingivalis SJD2]
MEIKAKRKRVMERHIIIVLKKTFAIASFANGILMGQKTSEHACRQPLPLQYRYYTKIVFLTHMPNPSIFPALE